MNLHNIAFRSFNMNRCVDLNCRHTWNDLARTLILTELIKQRTPADTFVSKIEAHNEKIRSINLRLIVLLHI